MASVLSRLSPEIHSSAHQARFDGTLVGEYEIHIYRGGAGPVVILEGASGSALPLEYLSEYAVKRFVAEVPISGTRFFEHHRVGEREVFVEVGFEFTDQFFRRAALPNDVAAAMTLDERGSAATSASGAIGTLSGRAS